MISILPTYVLSSLQKNRWYWKWYRFLSYFPHEKRTKLKNTESLIANNNYFLIWLKVIFSKTISWKWKQRKFQNQIQKFLEFFLFRRFVAADVTPCSWNHKLVLPAECPGSSIQKKCQNTFSWTIQMDRTSYSNSYHL
jgi:hypothetical protein